jgi:chaperonin GroEL
MAKKAAQRLVFQPEALEGIHRGINWITEPISATLGPRPRYVAVAPVIRERPIELLDNGGVIARRVIELPDPDADMGAMLVRNLLWHLHENVGDGTATAAVIFRSVCAKGMKYLAAGGDVVLLRQYLLEGLQVILQQLAEMTIPIAGQKPLAQLAKSICHDSTLAALLGEVFDAIGEHGELEIRTGYDRHLRAEYLDGAQWSEGVLSKEMLTGASRVATLQNPSILITDLDIETPEQLIPALEAAMAAGSPSMLVVARTLSERATGFVVMNSRQGRFPMLAVKTPGDINTRGDLMHDMAVLTGGQPLLDVAGDSLASVKGAHLGHARRVWVNENRVGIVGGKGDPRRISKHYAQLVRSLDQTDDPTRHKNLMERIGKLVGGSATLWIGGTTISETEIRKELASRTARTMRGAIRGGVLPGGGSALLACRMPLRKRLTESGETEERAAYTMLLEAVEAPIRTILSNTGYDPGEILAEINQAGPGCGFDVERGRCANMTEAGILDAARAYTLAVQGAISGAAQALSISVLVHRTKPEFAMNT